MKTEVQIRPEQAKKLIALNEQARAAERTFAVSLEVALSGLVSGEAQVSHIAPDGTITVTVPDMPDPPEADAE